VADTIAYAKAHEPSVPMPPPTSKT
jgi:hypothetical protein